MAVLAVAITPAAFTLYSGVPLTSFVSTLLVDARFDGAVDIARIVASPRARITARHEPTPRECKGMLVSWVIGTGASLG